MRKNNLKVGDEVKYTIGDQSEATSLQICGIYKVDSDFEIYDSNEEEPRYTYIVHIILYM